MGERAIDTHFDHQEEVRLGREIRSRLHVLFAKETDSRDVLWDEADQGSETAYRSIGYLISVDNLEETPSRRPS